VFRAGGRSASFSKLHCFAFFRLGADFHVNNNNNTERAVINFIWISFIRHHPIHLPSVDFLSVTGECKRSLRLKMLCLTSFRHRRSTELIGDGLSTNKGIYRNPGS
jgi:hypothetical protein